MYKSKILPNQPKSNRYYEELLYYLQFHTTINIEMFLMQFFDLSSYGINKSEFEQLL